MRAGDAAGAVAAYERSEALGSELGDVDLAARASANAARARVAAGPIEEAEAALGRAMTRTETLSDSDEKARILIHLGRSYEMLETRGGASAGAWLNTAAEALGDALGVAERIGSRRSASFALGRLGRIYERNDQLAEALALTERALAAAQDQQAPDLLYRWGWQLARIRRTQGQDERALTAYRQAVRSLDEIRFKNAATGLDFETAVEPVYHELVDLLLRRAAEATQQRTELLAEARDRLEQLKSAQLNDYFQDACLAPTTQTAASAISGAAVIYPVILPDRIELILSKAGKLSSVVVPVTADTLDAEVDRFRAALPARGSRAYRRHAANLYDWLIRPIEDYLDDREIETVVFVPGGSLRTIPMAALYDREDKEFLIEKHAIATIPALSLTEPRPLDRAKVNTLRAGLTEAVQGFSPLEAVETELEAVKDAFGGRSLVNSEFVARALEEALSEEEFGIVHIATHAQFTSQSDESFLLTYDGRIGMEELGALVERTRYQDEPIELLTLSACQTAVGDERAALGLAGVAVRAGARSALATLWTVNDQAASDLVAEFYRQLAIPGTSKARALQLAQLSLLETRGYRHPGYWAAFLMISNWM
jgi:CHAT domain-containing protein